MTTVASDNLQASALGESTPSSILWTSNFYEGDLQKISRITDYSPSVIFELKVGLLANGINLTSSANSVASKGSRYLQQVRSGASNGLDIVLPLGFWVNVPVTKQATEYTLDFLDGTYRITIKYKNDYVPVAVVPKPLFYDDITTTGHMMKYIGQMSGDRIGFGLTNGCYFWKEERRCQFCSIGTNTSEEVGKKNFNDIIEVLSKATADPVMPAKHVLISGGTLHHDDWGVSSFQKIITNIKHEFNLPIYLMAVPPQEKVSYSELCEAGVTEMAMNLEIFSDTIAQEIIPGKRNLIGKAKYLQALTYARRHWGRKQVRSLLVVGLEPLGTTLDGVRAILDAGGTPVLSVFRPLVGSKLENHPRPKVEFLLELYDKAVQICESYGATLGPECSACKNNILAC